MDKLVNENVLEINVCVFNRFLIDRPASCEQEQKPDKKKVQTNVENKQSIT